ncbi:hypothetical protein GCM10022224_007860 [Nonomuraea antimicrobica]|uniref:Uncharacterized protein n=1 Tax=Nonomuraea antimicrobica TaxID=561173 RepID=A0ABP7B478_9ACTN
MSKAASVLRLRVPARPAVPQPAPPSAVVVDPAIDPTIDPAVDTAIDPASRTAPGMRFIRVSAAPATGRPSLTTGDAVA